MTYEQALQFWYSRINYELRTIQPGDLKLDRMRALLAMLGDPHEQLRIVHIAGSKGKGSTAAMLAAMLHRAGCRPGLFTSPHLCDVRERIQIGEQWITPDELAQLMTEVADVVNRLDAEQEPGSIGVTFFEIITALAFLHFLRRGVEVAVMEVGLGGRFDATNVCQPALSIITSISFDHVQQLGNTLARIAFEKAGILKPGRPAISGVCVPEAQAVIEEACRERGVPLLRLGQEFHYTYEPGLITTETERWPVVRVVTESEHWPAMPMKLLGEHQAANATLAIAAVEELRAKGLTIPTEAVAAGLELVHWPARLEVVRRQPLVVLDCAHNLASARVLLETLQQSFPLTGTNGNGSPPPRRFLLFAGSYDKDLAGMLRILAPYFDHVYLTSYHNNPRFIAPDQLAQMLQRISPVPFSICPTAAEAWQQASTAASSRDLICITGSVFLAGELRPLLV